MDGLVDAVIGRLILMHLKDPAVVVRALSALVRPGGIISFQERAAPAWSPCSRALRGDPGAGFFTADLLDGTQAYVLP